MRLRDFKKNVSVYVGSAVSISDEDVSTQVRPCRTIGETIRLAYEQGIQPDFPLGETAFDDEGVTDVDPYADIRTDKFEHAESALVEGLAEVSIASAKEAAAAAAAAAGPVESVQPTPAAE